jgi:hypothetical protein
MSQKVREELLAPMTRICDKTDLRANTRRSHQCMLISSVLLKRIRGQSHNSNVFTRGKKGLTRRRGGLGIEFRCCPRRFVAMRVSWSAPAGRSFGWEWSASKEKIQSGVKPPQSKKPESGLNFWKMITLASWREILSPTA